MKRGARCQLRKGPLGDPRIDERERQTAPVRLDDQVRPEFGFDPDAEIGPPVIEETRAVARMIERHELVEGALGKPLGHELRGGDGAGGDENAKTRNRGEEALGERQDGKRLADARRMDPDKEAGRTGERRPPEAFAAPERVFLAPRLAAAEQQRHDGRKRARHRPVGDETGR